MKEPPINKREYPEECDGCCYRYTCSHDLEKCCYLVGNRCIVNEYEKKLFIQTIKKGVLKYD